MFYWWILSNKWEINVLILHGIGPSHFGPCLNSVHMVGPNSVRLAPIPFYQKSLRKVGLKEAIQNPSFFSSICLCHIQRRVWCNEDNKLVPVTSLNTTSTVFDKQKNLHFNTGILHCYLLRSELGRCWSQLGQGIGRNWDEGERNWGKPSHTFLLLLKHTNGPEMHLEYSLTNHNTWNKHLNITHFPLVPGWDHMRG